MDGNPNNPRPRRGRPRIHPLPDPNAPKRPRGRPRGSTFRQRIVNPPNAPKRNPGRPRNPERSEEWQFTLPYSLSRQLNQLQGVWGPTRSSTMQAIVRLFLDAIGEEGVANLKRANRYGDVIAKRKEEERAKRANVQMARIQIVKRSGGWMDADGHELTKNS